MYGRPGPRELVQAAARAATMIATPRHRRIAASGHGNLTVEPGNTPMFHQKGSFPKPNRCLHVLEEIGEEAGALASNFVPSGSFPCSMSRPEQHIHREKSSWKSVAISHLNHAWLCTSSSPWPQQRVANLTCIPAPHRQYPNGETPTAPLLQGHGVYNHNGSVNAKTAQHGHCRPAPIRLNASPLNAPIGGDVPAESRPQLPHVRGVQPHDPDAIMLILGQPHHHATIPRALHTEHYPYSN